MLKLDATTKTIEVDIDANVTTTALPVYATYSDISTSTFGLTGSGSSDTSISTTTAVTAVSAPSASTTRKIDFISIYNADTVAATVTIQLNNNATLRTLVKRTIQPGETLQYADGEGWSVVGQKKGLISTLNSTSTGTTSYTGTGEQNYFSDVEVSCYSSDQAGTLFFDFSINGTDWRTFPTSGFSVAAGVHEFHTAVKGPRYFRVRWSSSGTPTVLQIQTAYGQFRAPNAPLNQAYSLDADSLLVRPSFDWLDVSRGLATGITTVDKFGVNDSVGTSWEVLTSAAVYPTPTSAVSLEFVSSDTADALDDTGAHEITIEGLDANYELQTVSTAAHATDGLTAVAISGTWTRVFRAYVSKSGTYATTAAASHVGTITIRVAGAGATYATIPVYSSLALGQSLIGAYTIPSGYTGHVFLTSIGVDSNSGGSGKTVDVAFFSRDSADDTASSYDGVMRVRSLLAGLDGGVFNRTGQRVPLGGFTGPCDVGFFGISSTGTSKISVEFEVFLVAE